MESEEYMNRTETEKGDSQNVFRYVTLPGQFLMPAHNRIIGHIR
jgi:hypothetical protein